MNKLILAALVVLVSAKTHAAQSEFKVESVKDNVYRFSAGSYHSVFMITKQGAVVTDPINAEAASWLKNHIKTTFNVPVRYMIYSHNHIDHTQGGQVLDSEQTTVVAHELAAHELIQTKSPTAPVELSFADELTLNLDQSSVELKYYGANNGKGNISMRFMPANVVHVVDWVVVGRMPYKNLMGYDVSGMIHSTKKLLEQKPFDVFVGGHANMGTAKDVEHYLSYLEELYAVVRDSMLEGKTLSQIQQEVRLDQYADFKMYQEWLPLNIEGVYNSLIEDAYFNFRPDLSISF